MTETLSGLEAFDFELPESQIALRPAEPRDSCKLLVVEPGSVKDRVFTDILDCLQPGDLLVGNDTKVIPALIFGVRPARTADGMDVDVQVNLLEQTDDGCWTCLCKPGRRLKPGDVVQFGAHMSAEIKAKMDGGRVALAFDRTGPTFWEALHAIGAMPIPPYIHRLRASDASDHQDYQTVFANEEGSVAAPTAGLHFTDRLLEDIQARGVGFTTVTLHVGAGTFAPLSEENLASGRLHSEYFSVSEETFEKIRATKANGGRVIAIGTTALRTLESLPDVDDDAPVLSGNTDIFIRPGYAFRYVDGLITNFHLPKSSLFMLICALMGTDTMQAAYAHAIQNGYRFYSYGDACLLMPQND